ncbi:MAG: division/cell wall cluster transcriptional repressor MraZ [Bacteroidetes bacterium]|nr:division/cell wall cluster transcriptional repressor MraZ [Bacteroidota bacterium]MBP6314100.1 division/cell wall cluster transcriptional repressor MraZ [Chitinophagaceae bacterium]
MTRTYGEYEVTLDSKGRIMLPAGYKKQLPQEESNGFMLTKGNGNFLMLYTASQWKKVEEKLDTLNDYNEEAMELKFSMMNGASPIEMDAAGRIVLSNRMKAHAGLVKNVIMLGMSDYVVIWDAAAYEIAEKIDSERKKMLTGKILGANFLNPIKGT